MHTKDNFSRQANIYAKFRPSYPAELYEYLYSRCKNFENAWDCGTGNGQVATQLAQRFTQVYATDISQEQLHHAKPIDNVEYRATSAENSSLKDSCIDLITVAQAIHWFDFEKFFEEAGRIARKECILAYWAYDLPKIEAEIDEVL